MQKESNNNKAAEIKGPETLLPSPNIALQEAQALTNIGSWQWDVASGVLVWSDELYRIYGLDPNTHEASFEDFMSRIHPEDQEWVQELIRNAYTDGKFFDFEHRIVLPDKQERFLHGKGEVVKDKAGQTVRMYGTSQDVTERKQAEEALKLSNKRFQTLTWATHDLVYDLDLQADSVWFNEVLQKEYGYPTKKNTSKAWCLKHIHPEDVAMVKKQIRDLRNDPKQETWKTEFRFQKANGDYALLRNRAFVLRDANGEANQIIGSLLDITAQRQLENAKDEFISLVSHQLRTPLTAARLSSEMLAEGIAGELTPAQKMYADNITAASIRMIGLVGDVLNISRIELGRVKVIPSKTDVNEIIKTQIKESGLLAKEKRTALEFIPQSNLPKIALDTSVLKLMLDNLVSNAIRYTQSGGKIKIKTSKHDNGVRVSISDNGIGIPEKDQERIFTRFYRADNAVKFEAEGTGLGLYLVKLISDTVGTNVWFESVKNKGTTFYIQLPLDGMKANEGNLRLE